MATVNDNNPVGGTPNTPTPKTGDYLGLYLNRFSTEEIKQGASARSATVVMPGREASREKYKNLSDSDFNQAYDEAFKSYSAFKNDEFNGYTAPLWKYGTSTPDVEKNGRRLLSGATDKPASSMPGIPGLDVNGNQFMTEEEIADSRGEVFNDKTKQWEKYTPGIVDGMKRGLDGIFHVAPYLYMLPYAGLNLLSGGKLDEMQGDAEVLYKAYDKDNIPVWHKANRNDVADTQKIKSVFGAEPMTRSYLGAFSAAVYNIVPSVVSSAGSLTEITDNFFDLLTTGKDEKGMLESYGENLQKFANSFKIPKSQRAQQSAFDNGEAFFSGVGEVAAQVGLMYLTGGASKAIGMGTTASSWMGYSSMGMIGMDMFNQSAKEMGINQLDIAWMAPILFAIETGTEALIGPDIINKGSQFLISKAEGKQAIKNLIKDGLKEGGVNGFDGLSKGQKLGVVRKIARYMSDVLPITGPGRAIIGAGEEGLEEVTAQPMQNFLQMQYDLHQSVKDPLATPGNGMFGDVNKNDYLSTFLDRIPEGLTESFVLGFIGGGIGVGASGQWKGNFQAQTIHEMFSKGKEQEMRKLALSMKNHGELAETYKDEKGNVITSDKLGTTPSLNDLAYESIIKQLDLDAALANQYGILAPGVLGANGGIHNFLGVALGLANEVHSKNQQIAALAAPGADLSVVESETARLKQEIADTEAKIADITSLEVLQTDAEGKPTVMSKFSKGYNQELKTQSAFYSLAVKQTDDIFESGDTAVTEEFRTTPEYQSLLSAIVSTIPKSIYNDTTDFNNEGVQGYKEHLQQELDAKEAARPDSQKNFNDILGNFKMPEGDAGVQLNKVSEVLSQLDAIKDNFNASPDTLASFKAKIKDINSSFAFDLDNPESEAGLKNWDQLQANNAKQIAGIDSFLGTPHVKPTLPSDAQIRTMHYTAEIEAQMAKIKDAIDRNLEGDTLENFEKDIQALSKNIVNVNAIAKVANDAIGKKIPKDHLNQRDHSLSDSDYKAITEKIDGYRNTFKEMLTQAEQIAGSRSLKQKKIQQIHVEMARQSLVIIANKLSATNLEILALVQKMEALETEKLDVNNIPNDKDLIKLDEHTALLNEIETKIHAIIVADKKANPEQSKRLFNNVFIKGLVSNFVTGKRGLGGLYTHVTDYEQNYIENAITSLKDGFLDTDIAQVYFVAYLNNLYYNNKNDITQLRSDILKRKLKALIADPTSDVKISSYEQNFVEEHILAFLNSTSNPSDTEQTLTQKIIEAEKEITIAIQPTNAGRLNYTAEIKEGITDKIIPNSIYIRGDYATGKTSQVLREALMIQGRLNANNLPKKILVVAHTPTLLADLQKYINSALPAGQKVTAMSSADFAKAGDRDFDMVVWDEAALLTDNDLVRIKAKMPKGSKAIFLGDNSQMKSTKSGKASADLDSLEAKTVPITVQYSTDYPFILQLAAAFKKTYRTGAVSEAFPALFEDIVDGHKVGGKYFESLNAIVESFVNSTSTDKALILFDEAQYKELEASHPSVIRDWKSSIYVLEANVLEPRNTLSPESIQGLRKDEIYIGADIFNLGTYLPQLQGELLSSTIAAAGYTAVGRARNYIALRGNSKNMAPEKNWHDKVAPNKDALAIQLATDIQDRIARLDKVYQKTLPTDISVAPAAVIKPVVKPVVPVIVQQGPKNVSAAVLKFIAHQVFSGKPLSVQEQAIKAANEDYIAIKVAEEEAKANPVVSPPAVVTSTDKIEDSGVLAFDKYPAVVQGTMWINKTTGQEISIDGLARQGSIQLVRTTDGEYIPLLNWDANYMLMDTDIHEAEGSIGFFRKQGDNFDGTKKNLWSSSYTVLSAFGTDVNSHLTPQQIRSVRAMSPVLLRAQEYFQKMYSYIPAGIVQVKGDVPGLMKDMLFIKLQGDDTDIKLFLEQYKDSSTSDDFKFAIEEIKASLTAGSGLPLHYRYLMSSGDTEFDYTIDGENRVIEGMDYIDDYTAIINKITNGFHSGEEGLKGQELAERKLISQLNREVNLAKAKLRHEGAMQIRNNPDLEEVVLGNVPVISQIHEGKVDYKLGEGGSKIAAFIEKWTKLGIQFEKDSKGNYLVDQKATKNGKTSLIIRYAWNRKPTATDGYIIVRMPKIGAAFESISDITKHFSSDVSDINKIDEKKTLDNFNSSMRKTKLYNFLTNNKSIIVGKDGISGNDVLRNFFSQYGTFVDAKSLVFRFGKDNDSKVVKDIKAKFIADKVMIKENGFSIEKEIALQLLKDMSTEIANPNSSIGRAIIDNMYLNSNLKKSTSTYSLVKADYDRAETDASTIHHPSGWVDIAAILEGISDKVQPPSTGAIDSSTIKPISISRSVQRPPKEKPGPHHHDKPGLPASVTYEMKQAVEELIIKIFGKEFLLNHTEFITSGLFHNGRELYGLVMDGKIKYELTSKGVEITTPRHEIMHIVFNYLLSDTTRSQLYNEVRAAATLQGRTSNLSDQDCREWMAQKYGARSYRLSKKSPWYTPSGMLQRFISMVDSIFERFHSNTPILNDLMDKIEMGHFRNTPIEVNDTSINTVEYSDKNTDNFVVDDVNEELNTEALDTSTSYDESAIVHRKNYYDLHKTFGSSIMVNHFRSVISHMINDNSYFSSSKQGSTRGVIHTIQYLKENAYKDSERASLLLSTVRRDGSQLFKRINEMTPMDYEQSDNDEDQCNYEDYHLGRPETYLAIISNIFPNLKIGAVDGMSAMNNGVDSIQLNYDQIDWSKQKNKFLKWQLEITPYNHFVNGKKVGNWNGKEFISMAGLEISLNQAAAKAKITESMNKDLKFRDEFFKELRNIANVVGSGSVKSNTIFSFIEKFDREMTGESNKTTYGFRELIENGQDSVIAKEKGFNPSKNSYDSMRAAELEMFMNGLYSNYKSMRLRSNVEMQVSGFLKEKTYKLLWRNHTSYEDVKNDIIRAINSSIFDGSVINKRIRKDMVKVGNKAAKITLSKTNVDDITGEDIIERGIFQTNGNTEFKIIQVDANGNASFTEMLNHNTPFDIQLINQLFGKIGVRTYDYSTILSMLYEGTNKDLLNYITDNIGIAVNDIQDTKSLLANSLYQIYLSIDSNIDSTDRINAKYKEVYSDASTTAEEKEKLFKAEKKSIENSPIHKAEIDAYLKKLAVQTNDLDSQESLSEETEDDTAEEKTVLPKPSDFYNFFNILGLVKNFVSGEDHKTSTRMPDNTKMYNHTPSSHFFDKLQNGTDHFNIEFGNILKEILADSKRLGRALFTDGKEVFNAILDPGTAEKPNYFKMYGLNDFNGLSFNNSGTKTPSDSDFLSMQLNAFIEQIKKNPAIEIILTTTTNISDTGRIYLGKYTFDETGKDRLIQGVGQKGNLAGVSATHEMINDWKLREFKQKNRNFQVSKQHWLDFLGMNLWDGKKVTDFGFFAEFNTTFKTAAQLREYVNAESENFRQAAISTPALLVPYQQFTLNMTKHLVKNFDFFQEDGNDNAAYISVGNALAFDALVYNEENWNKIVANKGILTTQMRRKMWEPHYRAMATAFSQTGYRLPKEISDLTPGKIGYYATHNGKNNGELSTQKRVNAKGEVMSEDFDGYNPILEAYMHAFEMTNNAINPLVIGHADFFTGETEKSKRTGPHATGGMSLELGTKNGLEDVSRTILVKDMMHVDSVTRTMIEAANGQSWGSLLWHTFYQYSSGGKDYGTEGGFMSKVITNQTSLETGNTKQDKEAVDYTTSQLYAMSPQHREMTEIMLRHTDELMKKDFPHLKFKTSLYDKFMEFYNASGDPGRRSAGKAAENLHDWIVYESGFKKEIVSRLVWKIQNETTNKKASTLVNQYEANSHEAFLSGYDSSINDNREIKIVLNANKDVTDNQKLADASQIESYMGVGTENNRQRAQELDSLRAKLYELGKASIEAQVEAMESDLNESEASADDIHIDKMRKFLRARAKKSLDDMASVGSYAEMIMNPKIGIDIPQIRAKILQAYGNYVNRVCIKLPTTGFRMIQSSGVVIRFFEDKQTGILYTLQEIERINNREYSNSELIDIVNSRHDSFKNYTVRTMDSMTPVSENGKVSEVKRGLLLIPMSYMSEFDVREDETLNDLFSIRYKNSKGDEEILNLRKSSRESIITDIQKLQKDIDDNDVTIDYANTPILRGKNVFNVSSKSDGININNLITYVETLQYTLEAYGSRTPASHLGSGGIYEVAGIITDNGNTGYTPPGKNALDDSDQDIDEYSMFIKALDKRAMIKDAEGNMVSNPKQNMINNDLNTIQGIQNRIHEIYEDAYEDVGNAPDIFLESSTKDLDDISNGIYILKAGDTLETIAKEFQTTAAELMKINHLEEGQVLPVDSKIKTKLIDKKVYMDNSAAGTLVSYKEAKKGADSVGIFANTAAAFSLMATMGENLKALAPSFTKILDSFATQGKKSQLRRITAYLQLALDNAKKLTLGKLNISKHSTNLVGVMVMTGKTDVEIARFMSNPIIARVYNEVASGDGVEVSRNSTDIFKVIQKYINQNQFGKATDQEIINTSEAYNQSVADRDAFMALNTAEVNTEKYQNELSDYNSTTNTLGTKLTAIKNYKDLHTLKDLAYKAESLRRLSLFIQTRNGLGVMDYDFETFGQNAELYMGMTILEYLSGKVWDMTRHMDFFKSNNEEYASEGSDVTIYDTMGNVLTWGKKDLLDIETNIAQNINIPGILNLNVRYKKALTEYVDQQKMRRDQFLQDGDISNGFKKGYNRSQLRKTFGFKNRLAGYLNGMNQMVLDMFFKLNYSNRTLDISIPIEPADSESGSAHWVKKYDSSYTAMRLSNIHDLKLFQLQSPQWFLFIKNAMGDSISKSDGINRLKALNEHWDDRTYDSLVKNNLFKKLTTNGYAGMEFIVMANGGALTPMQIEAYSKDFKMLPKELQEILQLNELLTNMMGWRKGSLSDIMGTDIFEKISQSIETLKQIFASEDPEDMQFVDSLGTKFIRWLQHQKGMSGFRPKVEKKKGDNGKTPDTILDTITIGNKFKTKVVMRHNPNSIDPKKEYTPEYPVTGTRGFSFSSDGAVVTGLEPVRNLSASDMSALDKGMKVTKVIFQGHSYVEEFIERKMVVGPSGVPIEVAISVRKRYITTTGQIIELFSSDATSVTWIKSKTSAEQLEAMKKSENEALAEKKRLAGPIIEVKSKHLKDLWGQSDAPARSLSMLAPRAFTYKGESYRSVMHAYQVLKSGEFHQDTYNYYGKLFNEKSDADIYNMTEAKLNHMVKGNTADTSTNKQLLRELTIASIMQNANSDAVKLLTSYNTFTRNSHTSLDNIYLDALKDAKNGIINGDDMVDILDRDELLEDYDQGTGNTYGEYTGETAPPEEMPYDASKALPTLANLEGQRLSQSGLRMLLAKIKASVKGLNIIEENRASMANYPEMSPDTRSWVDSKGLHVNMDTIKSSTPMHELNHIWLHIAKVKSPALYASLQQQAQDIIDEGGPIIDAIREEYPLEGEQFINEVIATLGGFNSMNQVEAWLLKNNVVEVSDEPNFLVRAWNKVKGFARHIRDYANSILSDLYSGYEEGTLWDEGKTLNDLFGSLTAAMLSGDEIINLRTEENEAIFYAYYGNNADRSIPLSNKSPIANVKDFLPHLNNNATNEKSMDNMNTDGQVEHLFGKITAAPNNGKYSFKNDGMKMNLSWPVNTPASTIREDIRNKIIPLLTEAEFNAPNQTIAFLNEAKTNDLDTNVEIAGRRFGLKRFSDEAVAELADKLHVGEAFVSATRYSQLEKDIRPEVRALYNGAFRGYDPIVIIHSIDAATGKMSISLYDISTRSQSFTNKLTPNNALTSVYMNTKEYIAKNGIMNNSAGNMRLALLGMTLLQIKNNANVVVRNVSVLDLHNGSVDEHSLPDVDVLLNEVKILTEIPGLMDAISNEDLKAVLMKKELYKKTQQSYLQQITDNLQQQRSREGGWRAGKRADALTAPGAGRIEQLRVLRRMQKEITDNKATGISFDEAYDDSTYQLISKAIRELSTNTGGYINSLQDMGSIGKLIISMFDLSSDVAQWFIEEVSTAKQMVVSEFRKYQNDMNPLHKEMIAQYRMLNPGVTMIKGRIVERIFDMGSLYYQHLFKTLQVVDNDPATPEAKRGGIVQVRIPEIHHTLKDAETMALYKEGKITDLDLRFANKWLDNLESRWIQNILAAGNQNLKNINEISGKENYSIEEAKKAFSHFYTRGIIPVMSKSVNELLSKGEFKNAWKQEIAALADFDNLFQDQIGQNSTFDKVSNYMDNQHSETTSTGSGRYDNAGLGFDLAGQVIVKNKSLNNSMSTNMENIGNYFEMEGIRKEIYERDLIPVYNNTQAIFKAIEKGNVVGQKNNIDAMRILSDRAIHGKNQDPKETLPMVVRASLGIFSNISLGWKAMMGVQSASFNVVKTWLDAFGVGLGDYLAENPDMVDQLPTQSDVAVAHAKMATDFTKLRTMASTFQLYNASERDLLESMWHTETNKRLTSTEVAHLPNSTTDAGARIVSMASWFHMDGSLNAYGVDKVTGEMTYDVTKDNRFYWPDGRQRTEKHEDVILKALRERLIKDRLQDESNPGVVRGHSYIDITKGVKWFTDKFIIGTMDDQMKALISSDFRGALAAQFRLFSVNRLNNLGLVNKGTKSLDYGTGYTAVQDENGEWISQRDRRIVEDILTTWGKAYKAVMNMKNESFGEWYSKQPAIRRKNIILPILQLITASIVMGIYESVDKKDKKRMEKFAWLMSELIFVLQIQSMIENPFPIASIATDAFQVAMGNRNVSALVRYTGPVSGVWDVEKYYETLAGEQNSTFGDWNPEL